MTAAMWRELEVPTHSGRWAGRNAGGKADIDVHSLMLRAMTDAGVQKLHAATVAALEDPATNAPIETQGSRVVGATPATLAALLSGETR